MFVRRSVARETTTGIILCRVVPVYRSKECRLKLQATSDGYDKQTHENSKSKMYVFLPVPVYK